MVGVESRESIFCNLDGRGRPPSSKLATGTLLGRLGVVQTTVHTESCEPKNSEGKRCLYFGLVPHVVSRCTLESVSVLVAVVFIRNSLFYYQVLLESTESCHQVIENRIGCVWPRDEL